VNSSVTTEKPPEKLKMKQEREGKDGKKQLTQGHRFLLVETKLNFNKKQKKHHIRYSLF